MYELLQKIKYTDIMIGLGLALIGIGVGWSYFSINKLETKLEIGKREETKKIILKPSLKLLSPTAKLAKPRVEVLGVSEVGEKINLNSAGMDELDKLSGIGPALAKRIIEYREKNQGFKNLEEIRLVKGIGEKLFEKIKEQISI